MAHYECTFVARQDLSKPDLDKLIKSFEETLGKHGGKVEKIEHWGLRTLAYEINKQRKGHYTMLCVTAENEAMEAFRTALKLSEDVIRNLEIKVEKFDNKPSPMMRGEESAAA
jgi:small subunit ribosomal protein S6